MVQCGLSCRRRPRPSRHFITVADFWGCNDKRPLSGRIKMKGVGAHQYKAGKTRTRHSVIATRPIQQPRNWLNYADRNKPCSPRAPMLIQYFILFFIALSLYLINNRYKKFIHYDHDGDSRCANLAQNFFANHRVQALAKRECPESSCARYCMKEHQCSSLSKINNHKKFIHYNHDGVGKVVEQSDALGHFGGGYHSLRVCRSLWHPQRPGPSPCA